MKAKKLTSILLIAAIVLTLGISAIATEVSISPVDETGAGFEFYKLISIERDVNDTYDEYKFVNDYVKGAFIAAINNLSVTDSNTDSEILVYITNNLNNSTFAAALADSLLDTDGNILASLNLTKSTPTTSIYDSTSQTMTYTLADDGYYLILDVSNYGEATVDEQNPIISVVKVDDEPVVIKLKTTTHTTPGKIIDSIVGQIYDNDGNSVSIGDTVNFKITVEIPNYVQYTDSTFKVYDIMGAGYDFDSTSAVATIGGVTMATDDMTVAVLTGNARVAVVAAIEADGITTVPDDATLIEFDFGDIKSTFVNQIGQSLVITYSADVNDTAASTNRNDAVVLENDSYIIGNGIDTFTYGFEVIKKDEYSKLLEGVKFFLATSDDLEDDDIMYLTFDKTTGTYLFTGVADDTDAPSYSNGTWDVDDSLSLETGTVGTFEVFGLEKGTYWLHEYETLDGYNLLAGPVEITLPDDTTVSYEIINYTGIELPGTGGIGTIMFGIFGCLIIVGGATGITMLVIKLKRRYSTSR